MIVGCKNCQKKDQAKRAAETTKDGETESTTVTNAEPSEQQPSCRTAHANQQCASWINETSEH